MTDIKKYTTLLHGLRRVLQQRMVSILKLISG